MTTKIYYLDTLPGVGKTQAALTYMLKGLAADKNATYIYAAPTLVLLKEVKKNLLNLSNKYKINSQKIFGYHTDSLDIGEGKSYIDKVFNKLNDGQGCIILVSHSTFTNLPLNLPNRSKTVVFFDEAYSCILQPRSLKLSTAQSQELENRLELKKYTGAPDLDLYVLDAIADKASLVDTLKAMSKDDSEDRLLSYARLQRLVDTFNPEISKVYFTKEIKNTKSAITSYRVVRLPTKLFNSWREIYMMSAHLKKTQLWAMLATPGAMVDGEIVTEDGKPAKKSAIATHILESAIIRLIPDYAKRERAAYERYSRVTIARLTDDDSLLSTYKLKDQKLILSDNLGAVNKVFLAKARKVRLLQDLKIESPPKALTYETINNLIKDYKERRSINKLHTFIDQYGQDTYDLIGYCESVKFIKQAPFWWYLEQALVLCNVWLIENKIFVNKSDVLGNSYTSTQDSLLLANKKSFALFGEDPYLDVYRNKIRQSYRLIPAKSSGLNKYSKTRTLISIYSANPRPTDTMFYKTFLHEYDPAGDYAVSDILQAVTRTAIRNRDSKESVLIVVTDLATSKALLELMSDKKYPELKPRTRHARSYMAISEVSNYAFRYSARKPKTKPKLTKDENLRVAELTVEIERLRARINYYKNSNSKTAEIRICKLNKQRTALIAEKTNFLKPVTSA